MLVPLYDDNPVRRISQAYVNWALMAANLAAFVLFQSGYVFVDALPAGTVISYGLVPALLFHHADLPAGYAEIPAWATLLTSAFLHGSWLHLAGNMLFLWVFGDNVEDDLGHGRYLLFYAACAVISGLTHALTWPNSQSPLIGASGAVSGVVAAYLLLHPRVKLWVLVFFRIPLKLPAMWAIGAWVLFQAGNALIGGESDETAWFAHLGGLVAGTILTLVLKRADAPLFDRTSLPLVAPDPPLPPDIDPAAR